MLAGTGQNLPPGEGKGFGICSHGGRQLGVVGAHVSVDMNSGVVTVIKLTGAFDIGLIINRNTTDMGVKGAMIWGIGSALIENVELDGHRCYTNGFADYPIPRMGDIPEIDLAYLNNVESDNPRGCGEMPMPPTVAAIANAVFAATGFRCNSLPMTPEKIRKGLAA